MTTASVFFLDRPLKEKESPPAPRRRRPRTKPQTQPPLFTERLGMKAQLKGKKVKRPATKAKAVNKAMVWATGDGASQCPSSSPL